MLKFTKLARVLCLCLAVVLLTSAVPVGKKAVPAPVPAAANTIVDFSKMSNSELVKYAETLKGDKLTLKEKVGLKLFKKQMVKAEKNMAGGGKSQLVAVLLCFFVGALGIHRFYMGYTTIGIIQLLTLGGCGVWALIDFIRLLIGDLQPANGPFEETFT
ncbi:TM2 domain-containing protein [Gynurincola endophyticus]|jgi:TM2 domain-containing membrane protein YozV|uniref:TM2 domain-containing protein n=1 Tax=Gynurincola endophyticus TaxID=2479004 RepID=UPI001F289568|nr:TM2 domain-containing protein [Gynurincola endophyticus]